MREAARRKVKEGKGKLGRLMMDRDTEGSKEETRY